MKSADVQHLLKIPGVKVGGEPIYPTAVTRVGTARHVGMNKLEQAYGAHLEMQRLGGEVAWWKFDAIKLRLADATFYTPDFLVLWTDGRLTCDETKGFERDDAVVKFKVATEMYPLFLFRMVKREGGQWMVTRGGDRP